MGKGDIDIEKESQDIVWIGERDLVIHGGSGSGAGLRRGVSIGCGRGRATLLLGRTGTRQLAGTRSENRSALPILRVGSRSSVLRVRTRAGTRLPVSRARTGARPGSRATIAGAAARARTAVAASSAPAPGSGSASRVFASGRVVHELDASAVHVLSVVLLDSALEVAAGREADDSLVPSLLVRVGVRDLAGVSHHVLEVLPGDARRQILDEQTVARLRGRAVPAAHGSSASISAAATAIEVVPVARAATRQLEDDAVARQILTVQVVDRVIGVARRVELLEAEAALEDDLADSSVAAEEVLDVALGSSFGQPADVHSAGHA
ncbi:hypothetical protein PENTCL1PPCAC_3642, partial [Pristionchus entomophagus]